MKITAIIAALEALRERHGDLDVYTATDDGRGPIVVTQVHFHAMHMSNDPLELPLVVLETSETEGWEPSLWEERNEREFLTYMNEWSQNEIVSMSFFHRYDWTRVTWIWYRDTYAGKARFLRRVSTWQPGPPLHQDGSP